MEWRSEGKKLLWAVALFLLFFLLPVGWGRFDTAVLEALHLAKWYAREHVILCLVPAFFIAGAIGVFISQSAVMRYLGAGANKVLAYGVASVSGSVLAVCSCTILPLFAGIYKMGAGIGPATAFLYAGPAINVLAIILTANILGYKLGIARAVGAVLFSIIIGLMMQLIFKEDEQKNKMAQMPSDQPERALWQNGLYFLSMVLILVFANWAKPEEIKGVWGVLYTYKWWLTGASTIALGITLWLWFGIKWWKLLLTALPVVALIPFFSHNPLIPFAAGFTAFSILIITNRGETESWFDSSWSFAKQILPLLLFGVLVAGLLLGRVGHEGLIPGHWIDSAVGGNSLGANFFASFAGALMYFATLTEIPILQGLLDNGMGQGPALALLLAGPALSLPNMLVIRSVMGTKKTAVFVALVVVMATISGLIFGAIV